MRPSSNVLFLVFLLTALAIAACGADDAGDVPTPPTRSSTTQATSGIPSELTETPLRTAAPVVVKTPAATATLDIQPTTLPSPTPIPKKVNLKTADDFGNIYNPLTGEEFQESATVDRRPLAVKISNAPAQWVRPQSGLNDADLVFEHITEAGITRFTMIVYGKSPEDVGPIRSARLIDLELPAMYDAALVYSGSSEGVRQKLLASDFRSRILFGYEPGYYRTGESKPLEHTLYAHPEELWGVLEERDLNNRPQFNTYMAFNSDLPEGGTSASEILIDYDWTLIDWQYNTEIGRYLRTADGEPHLDQNTGEQVSASNVIVIFANHVPDQTICEQVINGVCTAYSMEIFLAGSGPAIIFRDGEQFDGTWHRAGRYDMLTFSREDGQPLPLQVGNSWIQVIPNWYEQPVEVRP